MKLLKFGTKIIKHSSKVVAAPTPTLPPNTIRCKFSAGYTPTMGDTQTLVDVDNNIWDIYKASNDWSSLFGNCSDLLEVLNANTSNVTDMKWMFSYCTSLTTAVLFDTSNVTDIHSMFYWCTSLTTIPLFDTSNVIDIRAMFQNCSNVESGALALYQQASTQANPPTEHDTCFRDCGSNTVTGAAELAQIPADWK